mmetsp:Transcript_87068/g.251487  ORF Transcript_87068/g.251487 Transcript_87068/m.251487 type:complete len:233 (+) Transcript_87068:535-1233(+)
MVLLQRRCQRVAARNSASALLGARHRARSVQTVSPGRWWNCQRAAHWVLHAAAFVAAPAAEAAPAAAAAASWAAGAAAAAVETAASAAAGAADGPAAAAADDAPAAAADAPAAGVAAAAAAAAPDAAQGLSAAAPATGRTAAVPTASGSARPYCVWSARAPRTAAWTCPQCVRNARPRWQAPAQGAEANLLMDPTSASSAPTPPACSASRGPRCGTRWHLVSAGLPRPGLSR